MRCRFCDSYHVTTCPLIKSIEYRPEDSSEARIEFWDGLVILPLPVRHPLPADSTRRAEPLTVFRGAD